VDKPINAVITYLPDKIFPEDTPVAFQEIDYDIISVKEMTANESP
jgi:hypothetical protein